MSWRVAKSLLTLRKQVDEMAPNRDKSSDGTIGDPAHQARNSDHNPNAYGVVTAMDITNDLAHGVDSGSLAEMLRISEDKRIKYVIANRRIFSSTKSPWQWRPYNGTNAHTKHVHVSVVGDEAVYDDTQEWSIDRVARVAPPPTGPLPTGCRNITATVFGGAMDRNPSSYDGHIITDQEFGVALPYRFPDGSRPRVRVTNASSGSSIDCDIVDVGPWNINDPYWETDARPQAESGIDLTGRKTNFAGIDLTPAAARAIGIPGKGKVNWQFLEPIITTPAPREEPVTGDLVSAIKELIDQLQKRGGGVTPMPASDLGAILHQVANLVQSLNIPKTTTSAPATPTTAQQQDQAAQLQKILDFVSGLLNPSDKSESLGQVNGALGQTIGKLLNGKKTALGVFGGLATALLANVPAGSELADILAKITPFTGAAGFSGYAMPVFLALTAWGVLGKLEKWAQGTAPPPTSTK